MIPMWMFGVAIACGNCFINKPSEKDPSVPLRLAELFMEAGGPAGVLQVVNGDKEAVRRDPRRSRHPGGELRRLSAIAQYVYSRGTANGKRVQAMGGAKNHAIIMPDADLDQVTNELIGAGYGSAGERCMAISVAVPITDKIGDALVERLKPRVESLRVGLATDPDADYGPDGDARAPRQGDGLHRPGREGRRRARRRRPRLQDAGLRERLSISAARCSTA